ncbi:MAG: hypothetical protein K7J46_05420 [Bryobacter sp.]|jgi:DNA repair ATPase RecN|nr:hypothetical protein [Bryobacter sp. CoA8 C33]
MNPLPENLLYPMESHEDLARMAAQLHAEYAPADPFEEELVGQLIEASWYRRRYEKVRSRLYERKNQLTSGTNQMAATVDSIRRFQHEVAQVKKRIASLRKTLRRYRAGELSPPQGDCNDQLLAA